MPITKWLRAISLVALTAGSWQMAVAADKVPNADAQELQRRGHALHDAVLELYQGLQSSGQQRKVAGPVGLDIRDLVSKFIPIGIPFSDANEILRAAGLKVKLAIKLPGIHDRITEANLRLLKCCPPQGAEVQLYPAPDQDPQQEGATVTKIIASIASGESL